MSHKKSAAKVTPDADLAKWCAALAFPAVTDQVPPGWMRTEEVAKLLGKSESHTTKQLVKAAKEGRCEAQTFRVRCGAKVFPVRHYRLK